VKISGFVILALIAANIVQSYHKARSARVSGALGG
jgi:hypothetical protein